MDRAEQAWVDYEYREHPKGLYHTCFVDGYRQAEKDLALTWEDVKQIAMISVELSRKRFDDFYVHQTISDEEHFSEVLRRFNEIRKK